MAELAMLLFTCYRVTRSDSLVTLSPCRRRASRSPFMGPNRYLSSFVAPLSGAPSTMTAATNMAAYNIEAFIFMCTYDLLSTRADDCAIARISIPRKLLSSLLMILTSQNKPPSQIVWDVRWHYIAIECTRSCGKLYIAFLSNCGLQLHTSLGHGGALAFFRGRRISSH